MTNTEFITKLKEHYDGRKLYCRDWYKKSVRIAFRKYKSPEKQFKDTVRYYKNLIYGKIFPVSKFKKIYLICNHQYWVIDIELADDGWVEEEMKRNGYTHPSEVIPDIGVYKDGKRLEDELVFENNKLHRNKKFLRSIAISQTPIKNI